MYMYRFTDYMYVRFTVHSAAARSAQFLYLLSFVFCEPAKRRTQNAERRTQNADCTPTLIPAPCVCIEGAERRNCDK